MLAQEIYEETQRRYKNSNYAHIAVLGTNTSPWNGPDVVKCFRHSEHGATHNPDAFVTGWFSENGLQTCLPVRR